MTDPRSELERVIAKLRQEAKEHDYHEDRSRGPVFLEHRVSATFKRKLADQLSAILPRSPCPADSRDSHDSQVIENAIPAVAENQRPPNDHD